VLHCVPPPVSVILHGYSLRPRVHDGVLPDRVAHSTDCNFIIRLLFYQACICMFVIIYKIAYFWPRNFGRPFVKQLALCYRTVVCLTVCLHCWCMYCGQTVGWIRMLLGIEVGLGPGYIVLDEDSDPFPRK